MFIYENSPTWDVDKHNIIGPESSSFIGLPVTIGVGLDNRWWRLIREEDQQVMGYGWIDIKREDEVYYTEISLCVGQGFRGRGYGNEIIDNLEHEIINKNYPKSIIANISDGNIHAEQIIRLLTSKDYELPCPISSAKFILNCLGTLTFSKQL